MSSEPSIVDDARGALELYRGGLPIDAILHRYPVSYFNQHTTSVWQVVFEKEDGRVAGSAIERMQIYETFFQNEEIMLKQKNPDAYARSVARLGVIYLANKADAPNIGLTMLELAQTIRAFLNHLKLIDAIHVEATKCLQDRIRITSELPPEHRAPKWVEKMREVNRVVDKVFISR